EAAPRLNHSKKIIVVGNNTSEWQVDRYINNDDIKVETVNNFEFTCNSDNSFPVRNSKVKSKIQAPTNVPLLDLSSANLNVNPQIEPKATNPLQTSTECKLNLAELIVE